jgi:universal stress protein A
MPIYNKIVIAVDPFIEADDIIIKAKSMLSTEGSIDMVYVIELEVSFTGAPFAPPLVGITDYHDKTRDAARDSLEKLAKTHGVPTENAHLLTGSTAKEIRKYAKNVEADCIVIGSHGRHGIGLLLGSTASSVIHGTPCDILIVKIQN